MKRDSVDIFADREIANSMEKSSNYRVNELGKVVLKIMVTNVFVRNFPGAMARSMKDYTKLYIGDPDHRSLYVGTNEK